MSKKKRLLNELTEDNENIVKKQNFELKYPEFKQTINSFNFIISELISNINKNNKAINELKNNLIDNSINDSIKTLQDHNDKILDNINIIKKQITQLKINFQNICIHKWVTNYKYILKDDIYSKNNSYYDCDESDLKFIEKIQTYSYTLHETINNSNLDLTQWKKKRVIENFEEYDSYDRETYHKCNICDYHHTINFYSK